MLRYILLKIQSNQWKIGDILPSEGQLAIKFGCNRNTVRSALIILRTKLLIEPINGVGNKIINNLETLHNIQNRLTIPNSNIDRKYEKLSVENTISRSYESTKTLSEKFTNNGKLIAIRNVELQHFRLIENASDFTSSKIHFEIYAKLGICLFRVIESVSVVEDKYNIFKNDDQVIKIYQEIYDDEDNLVEKSTTLITPENYFLHRDYSFNY